MGGPSGVGAADPVRRLYRRRHADERGAVMVIAAFALVALLTLTALSVDIGFLYSEATKAQRAADAASLAAAGELARVELATGDRPLAEAAARTLALDVAADNGFDDMAADTTVEVTLFRDTSGNDHAEVEIGRSGVGLFFGRLARDSAQLARSSEAVVNGCDADCGGEIEIPRPLGAAVSTGTGGDGFMAVRAGNLIFNLFHHTDSRPLQCVDVRTNQVCSGSGVTYPVAPYAGMETNYTPKLAPVGTRVYFVVQLPSSVGLGCWDGATHARCPGFAAPKVLANLGANAKSGSVQRLDGPVEMDDRLYLVGDDNRMYCWDLLTERVCTGFPRSLSLAGVHPLGKAGGVQFDSLPGPGTRIYSSLGPSTDGKTWVTCFDTATASPCSGWTDVSTADGRVFLFHRFDTDGVVNGVCARGGRRGGGDGSGHQCWTLSGRASTLALPWDFKDFGERDAAVDTTAGHRRTFFPDRGRDRYVCWDWTDGRVCDIAASNWTDTEEYAYVADGPCVIALGHQGKLWSFRADDGQQPCSGTAGVTGTIRTCPCRDSSTATWSTLVLESNTSLADFERFHVRILRPDGSVFFEGDLVLTGETIIDLRPLNEERPVPTTLTVEITVEVRDGREPSVWTATTNPGMVQRGGVVPTLVR